MMSLISDHDDDIGIFHKDKKLLNSVDIFEEMISKLLEVIPNDFCLQDEKIY